MGAKLIWYVKKWRWKLFLDVYSMVKDSRSKLIKCKYLRMKFYSTKKKKDNWVDQQIGFWEGRFRKLMERGGESRRWRNFISSVDGWSRLLSKCFLPALLDSRLAPASAVTSARSSTSLGAGCCPADASSSLPALCCFLQCSLRSKDAESVDRTTIVCLGPCRGISVNYRKTIKITSRD